MVWLWAVLSSRDVLKSSGAGTLLFVSALLWARLETKHHLAPIFLQERSFSSLYNHRLVWVGGFKDHLVPSPCPGQPLSYVTYL